MHYRPISDDIREFVKNRVAPLYVDLDIAIRRTGRMVHYMISYVKFPVQKESLYHKPVKYIIGDAVIQPLEPPYKFLPQVFIYINYELILTIYFRQF